jgi:hypothetical protein
MEVVACKFGLVNERTERKIAQDFLRNQALFILVLRRDFIIIYYAKQ